MSNYKKRNAYEKALSEEITQARKNNSLLKERLDGMKMEMELPGIRKRFSKFVMRQQYRRHVINKTPPLLRWYKWLEFYSMARGRRKRLNQDLMEEDVKKMGV